MNSVNKNYCVNVQDVKSMFCFFLGGGSHEDSAGITLQMIKAKYEHNYFLSVHLLNSISVDFLSHSDICNKCSVFVLKSVRRKMTSA